MPAGQKSLSQEQTKRAMHALIVSAQPQYHVYFCFTKTALIVPCCPGLEVTLAKPASVSMTAPFVTIFIRTKCGLAAFSLTVIIFAFFTVLVAGSRTLTTVLA